MIAHQRRRRGMRTVSSAKVLMPRACSAPETRAGSQRETSSPISGVGWGNVRSCNLSASALGNFTTQDWSQIADNPYPQQFRRELPAMCRGCAHASTCQGGCKESALATFGALDHPEPLVWLEHNSREALAVRQYDVPAIRLMRRRDAASDMSS